eukprot:8575825-Alexandrium_andersonii.AAC.1
MDAEAMTSDLDVLAKSCPYDPDTIKPGDFDFTPHIVNRDKADGKEKKSKKEDKDKEDPQDHKPKLPR